MAGRRRKYSMGGDMNKGRGKGYAAAGRGGKSAAGRPVKGLKRRKVRGK